MTSLRPSALRPSPVPLPASQAIRRTISWRSAIVVALGGSLLVVVSVGPMAAALGPALIVVWTFTAFIGVLQCGMLAELASRFPDKAGGTATYAHEGLKQISPLFGVVSNWGYWFAWTPGVAVNLILAAGYLRAAFWQHGNTLLIALALALVLYTVNYFGLRPSVWSAAAIALCALVPLAIIALAPLFRPGLFHRDYFLPFAPLGGSWLSGASWLLIVKWMFVAVWSSYGMEMASTVVAEMRQPREDAPRAMGAAALVGFLAYAIVPVMLLAIVGTQGLADDPAIALLPAARAIFGPAGSAALTVMLVAALVLGAQAFIIGSSRTIYQMSVDGLTLRQLRAVNRHGVPVGSMILDVLVTGTLLVVFREKIVDLVAAANVGYLIVFMLLPIAYLALRRRPAAGEARMPRGFIVAVVFVLLYNWILFVVGGVQWGRAVMVTGALVMLCCLPLYLIRRFVQDRHR